MGLRDLLEDAVHALSRQGPVIDLGEGGLLVVGDIHGYPEVARWALRIWGEYGYRHIVFLGDYTDRGPDGVGSLETVIEAFLGEPGRVVLLRGNHETPSMNYNYGFYRELMDKGLKDLYQDIVRLYRSMPYIARTSNTIILHGGIPCRKCSGEGEEAYTIEEIASAIEDERARGDDTDPGPETVGFHILWNDPLGSIEWFAPSIRGAYYYGRTAWKRFLEANGSALLVRGHEVVDALRIWRGSGEAEEGFSDGWTSGIDEYRGSVVTVFSSLYHGLRAGALGLEKNVLRLHVFGEG